MANDSSRGKSCHDKTLKLTRWSSETQVQNLFSKGLAGNLIRLVAGHGAQMLFTGDAQQGSLLAFWWGTRAGPREGTEGKRGDGLWRGGAVERLGGRAVKSRCLVYRSSVMERLSVPRIRSATTTTLGYPVFWIYSKNMDALERAR